MSFKDWSTIKKIGCGCSVLVMLSFGGCSAFVFGLFAMLRSTDAYETSLHLAQQNQAVISELGSPIEAGFWVLGSTSYSGNSGAVDISFSLSGPNGSGKLYVIGEKDGDTWTYSQMDFVSDRDDLRVDLLEQSIQ